MLKLEIPQKLDNLTKMTLKVKLHTNLSECFYTENGLKQVSVRDSRIKTQSTILKKSIQICSHMT